MKTLLDVLHISVTFVELHVSYSGRRVSCHYEAPLKADIINRCRIVLSSVSCGRPARLGSAIRGHNSRSNLQFHSRDWYKCRMLNWQCNQTDCVAGCITPIPDTAKYLTSWLLLRGKVKRVCPNNVLSCLFYNAVGTFGVLSAELFLN
jgi:hypothetical protein